MGVDAIREYLSRKWQWWRWGSQSHRLDALEKGSLEETLYYLERIKPAWFHLEDDRDMSRYLTEEGMVASYYYCLPDMVNDIWTLIQCLDNQELFHPEYERVESEVNDEEIVITFRDYVATKEDYYVDPVENVQSFKLAIQALYKAIGQTEKNHLWGLNTGRMKRLLTEANRLAIRLLYFQLK